VNKIFYRLLFFKIYTLFLPFQRWFFHLPIKEHNREPGENPGQCPLLYALASMARITGNSAPLDP
jgi:hypothetical protein